MTGRNEWSRIRCDGSFYRDDKAAWSKDHNTKRHFTLFHSLPKVIIHQGTSFTCFSVFIAFPWWLSIRVNAVQAKNWKTWLHCHFLSCSWPTSLSSCESSFKKLLLSDHGWTYYQTRKLPFFLRTSQTMYHALSSLLINEEVRFLSSFSYFGWLIQGM